MCIRDRLPPVASGTYIINEKMLDDLKNRPLANHASNLGAPSVSYTHLRAHETVLDLVCRLLLEKKKTTTYENTSELDTTTEISQRSIHKINAYILTHKSDIYTM